MCHRGIPLDSGLILAVKSTALSGTDFGAIILPGLLRHVAAGLVLFLTRSERLSVTLPGYKCIMVRNGV